MSARPLVRDRYSFGNLSEVLEIPDLIAVQRESFRWFLDNGLADIFRDISPITDFSETLSLVLEFDPDDEELRPPPKFSVDECKERDMTYAAPIFVRARFNNAATGEIKEQVVFMGDFPMMTDKGTFVVNGTERVVVSQLVRSPGVIFQPGERFRLRNLSKHQLVTGTIHPYRGEWIEFDVEQKPGKDVTAGTKIARKRRLPIFTLLRALGYDELNEPGFLTKFVQHFDFLEGQWEKERLPEGWEAEVEAGERQAPQEAALLEIYRRVRPGEPPSVEAARAYLRNAFFESRRYDLSRVGRYKLNRKLGVEIERCEELFGIELEKPDPDQSVLTRSEVLATCTYLLSLAMGEPGYRLDDQDHFANRRIRSVGELIQNQVRIGLTRMERVVRERMTTQDVEAITPMTLINPEGPNIGLIGALATYGQVNPFGFIESPYRIVKNGKVTDEIIYLAADEEEEYVVAQANAPLNDNNTFRNPRVLVRRSPQAASLQDLRLQLEQDVFFGATTEISFVPPDEVQLMDVSPKQIVSVATALIPFLEHDDANRALMGANMQRQAVPLVRAEAPYIGTGIEARAAHDAADMVLATEAGTVSAVDGDSITVDYRKAGQVRHALLKFERSNQDTCINQKSRVVPGDKVRAGQVLADGPSTDGGELALGKNLLVAFMSWEGYNFEDAVIVSERLVKDDVLTSIHIHEYEIDARDTKLGAEEITRDIPNLSDDILADLDDLGIVRVGAEVGPGDVLVGKVTPKGETELTPEERLLRAIFGEKAREVRDTSRPEAQDQRRRQVGRPPRQQGCHLQDPPDRGHAPPGRRHPRRHHPEPAGRSVPDERRTGARGAPRLRRPLGLGHRRRLRRHRPHPRHRDQDPTVHAARHPRGDPRVRRRPLGRGGPLRWPPDDPEGAPEHPPRVRGRRSPGRRRRQGDPLQRAHRREVRLPDHGWLRLHAEAGAPRGRQDPRPLNRPLLDDHPAAAGRQGAVRRPALRRDGGVGPRGVRRRLLPPGAPHHQVRRRPGPREGVRGDRQGRQHPGTGHPRELQGPHQGDAVRTTEELGIDLSRPERGSDEEDERRSAGLLR